MKYSDQSMKYMAGRAIREDDVKMVVDTAEKTGVKAVSIHGDLSLAKLVIGTVTVYAKYRVDKKTGITVEEVYSHRVNLLEKE